MVFPLVPLALAGLAVSGASNIYRSVNSANAYRQFARGYKNLDTGYRNYLARNGRKINPDRALTSYYGRYLNSQVGFENSIASALGSAGGTSGAGAMISSKYMGTSRWL